MSRLLPLLLVPLAGCLVQMSPDHPTAAECEVVRERGAPIGKERAETQCRLQEEQAAAQAADAEADRVEAARVEEERRECVAATLDLWWSFEETRGGPSLADERAEEQRQRELRRADRCYQLRADRPELEYVEVPCPPRGPRGRTAAAFVRAPSPRLPHGCEAYRADALEAWTEESP